MDAVKFIEEAKRMCNANVSNCLECCKGGACPINLPGANYTPEERVKLVEEWSAAHPRKTRQSVFLDNYPCARIDSQSVLYACPADAYGNNVCPKNKNDAPIICYDCRREFWTQEAE